MDGYEEKKWFVYMGDHHEGPFSLSDVQVKITLGAINSSSYVWAEGMGDWKLITEVQDFGQLMSNAAAPTIYQPQGQESRVELTSSPSRALNPTKSISTSDMRGLGAEPSKTVPLKKRRGFMKTFVYMAMIGALGAAGYTGQLDPVLENPVVKAIGNAALSIAHPALLTVSEKFPLISKWISPIPAIEDVLASEYKELREASTGSFTESGPKVALALSTTDPTKPAFYVASNLPDGTIFDIYVEGVGETLLNQLGHSSRNRVVMRKRLTKSQPVHQLDGKMIAKGLYEVYVVDSEQQPEEIRSAVSGLQPLNAKVPASIPKGFHLLATKTYFLGGTKDATYAARLKEFHDRIKEKAKTELSELHQFADTLESQLALMMTKFAATRPTGKNAKLTPPKKREWTAFNTAYQGLSSQLQESFAKYSPDILKTEFFYGVLFERTVTTFKALEAVHQAQNEFMNNPPADSSTFDIKLSQLQSEASSAVAALKAKIDQAEKIPPSPAGMPRRDGL